GSRPRSGRAGTSGVRGPGHRSRGLAERRQSLLLPGAAAPSARWPSTAARGGGLRRRRVRPRNCARRAAVVRSFSGSTAIRRSQRLNNRLGGGLILSAEGGSIAEVSTALRQLLIRHVDAGTIPGG